MQFVDGVPVAESIYGRDLVHPALHSELARLVPHSIADVILLDASTQQELDEQVARLPSPQDILWVGSPGMAIALARRFAPHGPPPGEMPEKRPAVAGEGGILVAVGSANPRSQRQADLLESMPGITLLRGPRERQPDPAEVLQRLAERAAQVMGCTLVGGVIATGGDTMQAILDRLGIHEFEILGELAPGFPLGRASLPGGSDLLLAMKAGGFGDDQALRSAASGLRNYFPATYATLE